MNKAYLCIYAFVFLAGCTKPPPDVPTCEYLHQRIIKDPSNGHTLLTPSPACMQVIKEAECGHCVWIVSGNEQFVGEAHQQVQQQKLMDTGTKDDKGKPIYSWQLQVDPTTKKPIMVSTWLNDKKPWSLVKEESIYLPAVESYAPLSTHIINECQKIKCSAQVDAFKIKLDSLNGISGALSNESLSP